MRELKPDEKERRAPDEEVVVEDLYISVLDAGIVVPQLVHLSEVVRLCDRVQKQN